MPRSRAYSRVRGICVAEDLRGHEADDAGDAVAVRFELGEIEIAHLVEIHLHAVDDRLQMRLLAGR